MSRSDRADRHGAVRLSALLLVLVPLFVVGPTLLAGRAFLPQVPAALEPFRSENPQRAALARDGQNYPQSDRLYPFLTDQVAMREALVDGELPRWEPRLGLGVPLFAESIAGAAYPPNWLAFAFPPELAAGPIAMVTLFLAGLGAWMYLRRIGLAPPARITGAIAYQLGSWGISNIFYYMKVDAALALPWALWAVEGLARGRRWSGLALTLALGASFLAGMPTIGVFVFGATAIYALMRLTPLARYFQPGRAPTGEDEKLGPLPPLLAFAGFALLGVLASAVLLLPVVEVSRMSNRQGNTASDLETQALPVTTSFGIVLPDFVGSPTESTPGARLPVAWWITPREEAPSAEKANQLEWNTYVGAAVVILALVGLIAFPRRAVIPLVLLLGAYAFAQGWPGMRSLYALPGLNAGAPGRVLAIAWFAWPWLAALGMQALWERKRSAEVSVLVLALAAAGAGVYAWTTFSPEEWARGLDARLAAEHPDRYPLAPFSPDELALASRRIQRAFATLAASGGLVFLAGLASRLTGEAKKTLRWAPLVGVIAMEGAFTAMPHVSGRPLVPREEADGKSGLYREGASAFPASPTIDAIREAAGDGRVLRYDASGSGLDDVQVLARPNMLQAYDVCDVTPWIVFPPRTYNELFAALDPPSRVAQGVSRLSDLALLDHPVLDLLRISAILSVEPIEHPRLEPVLEREGFHVYHRIGAFAPARIVAHALASSTDAAALDVLTQRLVDPALTTVLAPGHEGGGAPTPDPPGVVRTFERPTRDSIRIATTASIPAWLVVHEQAYPGWTATVNGEDVELVRADHVYQAVRIPDGDADVVLRYEPASIRTGIALSLVALVAALALSWRLRI